MSELIQFDGRTVAVIAPEDLETMESDLERLRAELDAANKRVAGLRNEITAMAVWLELNQPDVWDRGILDAVNKAAARSALEQEGSRDGT